ncbi:hypothetical protein SAMN04488109_2674 [Chryseolinea serpens]|uniref:Uncharacterized protein n=1 Tax=Chryseolinea serpens TaxID=947013 RepID=A0A1M5P4J3_9BACT|nr:hypothetical protein [Chryseolinea serpens]SHG96741.1 hypothetical protein SAMN04488109_2674 [Chryseolinea serpens]
MEFQPELYDYDFRAIYDTIKEYYPIEGGYKQYTRETLKTFDGYKKINQLVDENFFNKRNYKERWTAFQKFLQGSIDKKMDDAHTLVDTCFGGGVTIDKLVTPEYAKTKMLHYFISVFGPYYTVYAMDRSEVKLPTKMGPSKNEETRILSYHANHVATVSPVFEYELAFLQLQTKIKEWFPTYKFIPYDIGISTIDGISAYVQTYGGNIDAYSDSIYTGLFGPSVPPRCPLRGDQRFGFSEWIKPFSKTETELLEVLKQHIAQTASPPVREQTSLHKVWKLKHWKLAPTAQKPQGMFGMEMIDVMDLTDSGKVICATGKRKVPEIIGCKMEGDNLIFNALVFYKILRISPNELEVVMHVDIAAGSIAIKGALCEMTYETMIEWSDL